MKPINHIRTKKGMTVDELVREMGNASFNAKKLAEAADIAEAMISDRECKVFFGLAGAMVPAGMRQIVIDMLDYSDVFVTTGANLTHDLIEALGYHHYQGSANADDKKLNKKGIDRIYDAYMPNNAYEGLEKFMQPLLRNIKKEMNIREFLWEIGRNVKKESILKKCYDKKIPIFCPAISDSGIGLQVWSYIAQGNKLNVSAFDDLKEILDIAWSAKKTGVIYIGGGVPKNYIQQAMQFSKAAAYAVQITTDNAAFGGSSGAELREGISWGKLSSRAKHITVNCDATIALPIIHAALKARL
ncbi:MAG TPA: deoxyhypusine synthase [archaeon]|nr:deoxyhypusine synthase [archaeon]